MTGRKVIAVLAWVWIVAVVVTWLTQFSEFVPYILRAFGWSGPASGM